MTYDYHGSWESQADHHAPLYRRPWDTTNFYVNFTVNYWISLGATPSKLVLGIPTYGHSWTLSSSVTVPPAPASGAGTAGQYTQQNGFLGYYEICSAIKTGGWAVVTESLPNLWMGPYAYSLSTRQWVSYDDANMAAYKTTYALSKGLGGVMVWDLSTDDFHNTCSGGVNPLITAISNALLSGFNYTTIAPTTTQPTVAPSSTHPPVTTSSPATTQSPGGCKYYMMKEMLNNKKMIDVLVLVTCPTSNGLFANPASCPSTNYYECANGIAFLFPCPAGLYYNSLISGCDYLSNIKCPTTTTTATTSSTATTTPTPTTITTPTTTTIVTTTPATTTTPTTTKVTTTAIPTTTHTTSSVTTAKPSTTASTTTKATTVITTTRPTCKSNYDFTFLLNSC